MKRGFSLIELVIVILLVGIIYAIFVPKLNITQIKSKRISLENIKEHLLTIDFNESVVLKCIEESLDCHVKIDGELKNDLMIKNLFETAPEVYAYNKELDRLEFGRLELDTFEEHSIVFELSLNKDGKNKELVVETNKGVYVFNALYIKPLKYEYLNDIQESFENTISEVKNAF